ncbi:MAG: GTPase [Candidatus Nanohaloarchaea archaeon]|nr:GTPase [Candidatus Nanohaloarchaea archaeon]
MTERVVIMGAAGRDFHDFNTYFRDNPDYEVVAFTMAAGQNLGETEGEKERIYPPELAGDQYPDGVPIRPESELETIINEEDVDRVVLSYSDLSHNDVMHAASRAISSGADFMLIGKDSVMLDAEVPVIAVDAVRTGCGKSQTSRKTASHLKEMRFAELNDLNKHNSTIEEREEYEQHIEEGHVVYSGVDYEAVLEQAEEEADVILWDGGNNELPFFRPDIHFVLTDPHRPGHEVAYHPGESNFRMADYIIINKENTATQDNIQAIEANAQQYNPDADIIHADSVVTVENGDELEGKDVLVVEDGPTLTHGGTSYGAGTVAAEKHKANVIDPRDAAVGSINNTFREYPHLGKVLPAMGYDDTQISELQQTINNAECDAVLLGTPADIRNVLDVNKPVYRVRYNLEEKNRTIKQVLEEQEHLLKG